ncbi:hypothetical protein VNO77_27898 [Canavalia gladiata]|uniref:Uncharacterized protein n=1 Tax=Canavalia gladiata TaxID=3824 RepID=A0AAN9Q4I6_CANGL
MYAMLMDTFHSGTSLLPKLSQLHQFGNHERDCPGTRSFYGNLDSGGEHGVPAQTMFYVPTENRKNSSRSQASVLRMQLDGSKRSATLG